MPTTKHSLKLSAIKKEQQQQPQKLLLILEQSQLAVAVLWKGTTPPQNGGGLSYNFPMCLSESRITTVAQQGRCWGSGQGLRPPVVARQTFPTNHAPSHVPWTPAFVAAAFSFILGVPLVYACVADRNAPWSYLQRFHACFPAVRDSWWWAGKLLCSRNCVELCRFSILPHTTTHLFLIQPSFTRWILHKQASFMFVIGLSLTGFTDQLFLNHEKICLLQELLKILCS